MDNEYSVVKMTDKARRTLKDGYEDIISEFLRGFSLLVDNNMQSVTYETRKGMSIDGFLYDLGLSLEWIAFIILRRGSTPWSYNASCVTCASCVMLILQCTKVGF